jgi:sulfonate transport system substrate-binding protein
MPIFSACALMGGQAIGSQQQMSHTIAGRLGALTAASALALAAAACSSGGVTATDASAQGGGRSTVTINFGDQEQDFETLLTDSGVLKGADYKVNFVEFDSGPLVDAGFAAHRIDIGSMGDLPASLAVKSGLPVTAIAVSLPIGASEFLLARPGVTAISQLRGKPVAYTTGTAEQAFALRALHSAGLRQQDVQQVNVTLQELGTALESGAAYASVVSVEQKVDYEQTHPDAVILATQSTVSPPSYDYLLGANAALADPARLADIDDLLKRIVEAENWEKSHQSLFVTDYYVDVEHQTPSVAKIILAAGGTTNYVPIGSAVEGALQQVVALMSSAGAGADYSVAPLFTAAADARFAAILKEVPQND